MSKLLSTSLLALGTMSAMPAYANPTGDEFVGILRDTVNASNWQVKYLGGENTNCNSQFQQCNSNETFNWAAQRTYSNGILNTSGYSTAQKVSNLGTDWNSNVPWISINKEGYWKNGYYSYVTTYAEDFSALGSYQSIEFSKLDINYVSDDHLHAIVINGVVYSGFNAEHEEYPGWTQEYTHLTLTDIAWNVDGSNTIEFIVHNNHSNSYGGDTYNGRPSSYWNTDNATGFAATIQATYTAAIPEPETYAMMLAGLGMIGAVVRRRRNRSL
ncbi:MAG: PEPxxWA-CTERM sorting domain-containing protein [Betaproteobacteria bacterium]|jgi:hypothetical protein|nr:PEPxxWA-CTERM sorting domain-containing protein [Betaproteobacteria bacterium]